jgi:hypothetical protein
MRSRSDIGETLVTSGGSRGCGTREPGGAYLAVPLGPGGRPVEEFLIDPPLVVDAKSLGLSAIGVTLIDRDDVTHVFDVVGRAHYPTLAGFVDEIRRMGVSRRIAKTTQFARLGKHSRLLLLHEHADIANAPEFPTARRCPCSVDEHLAMRFSGMCARLWSDEPLVAAKHRLAVFASFPIAQIEVVRDPAAGRHLDTVKRAAAAGVAVVEVDQ